MDFVPSSGKREREGIIGLDQWFDYNENAKIDLANKPRCFIHSDCGNLIDALVHYNSNGKMDECLKDVAQILFLITRYKSQELEKVDTNEEKIKTNRRRI